MQRAVAGENIITSACSGNECSDIVGENLGGLVRKLVTHGRKKSFLWDV